MDVFARSPAVSAFGLRILIIALLLVFTAIWGYSEFELYEKSLASAVLITPFVFYLFQTHYYQISLDDRQITERRMFRTTKICWHEIDDILVLQNLTIVKSSQTAKMISIFHPSPGNVFHQLNALNNHHLLRDLILSRSIPFLEQVWGKEEVQRVYRYPSSSLWLWAVAASPLLVPFLAILVFDSGPENYFGSNHFYLALPVFVLSIYLAYRLGIFSKRNLLLLDDDLISLSNGTRISIPWSQITGVSETPDSLGTGSITIRSESDAIIVIPKLIDRFCDIALQIRRRVPDKFNVQLNMPLN